MSDSVNGVSRGSIAPQPANPNNSQRVPGVSGNGSGRASADVVDLTNTVEALQNLERQLADVPEIDRSKVDAIKQALASGEYQIDPQRVASKFIEIELSLGKL